MTSSKFQQFQPSSSIRRFLSYSARSWRFLSEGSLCARSSTDSMRADASSISRQIFFFIASEARPSLSDVAH